MIGSSVEHISSHKRMNLEMMRRVSLAIPEQMTFFIPKNNDQTSYISQSNEDWPEEMNLIEIKKYFKDYPPLTKLPFDSRIGICLILATSFLVGSFFKAILYCFVFEGDTKHNWTQRPINALTLTSAFVHHVTHAWLVVWYLLALLADEPLVDLLDSNWCHITQYIGVYGITYLSVGSLGISIYRVLYIRNELWVKNTIGERPLLTIICFLGIAISGLITMTFNMEGSSSRFQINMCNGISGTQAQIIMEYQVQQTNEPLPTTYLQMGSISSCLMFQMIEFSIYIWFFIHRYRHDNGNISKLLTEDIVRSRNMKNIGTFLGQFYGFIVEFSFLLVIFLLTISEDVENNHTKALLVMIKFVDFGLLSAVEVMTSPNLRSLLWQKTNFSGVS